MSALVKSTSDLIDACLFLLSSSGMTTPKGPAPVRFGPDNKNRARRQQEANCPAQLKMGEK
jgi:hypothetical protein